MAASDNTMVQASAQLNPKLDSQKPYEDTHPPFGQSNISTLNPFKSDSQSELTPRTRTGFLKENAWLCEQISHLQHNIVQLREENSRLHAHIEKLTNDLVVYHREHNEQELLLREAQEKAYSVLEDPMWVSDSGKASGRLNQFAKQTQQWSRKYAAQRDLLELTTSSETLRDSLARVLRLDHDGNLTGFIGLRGTSMALLACLTSTLFELIVTKPFFFLGNNGNSNGATAEGLMDIYVDTLCYDEATAHEWRSQTMRLLRPRSSTQDPHRIEQVVRINQGTHAEMRIVTDRLTTEFLDSPMQRLIQTDGDQAALMNDLRNLFSEAGELSYHISTQKVDLHLVTLQNLPSLVFMIENPLLEAHPSHRAQLDENPASLDGCEIVQMLHPAIVLFGNSDGTDYDKMTTWKKAIVWMGGST